MFVILDSFENRPVPIVDRFFRLIDLNGAEYQWREWLRWPKKKPDLEERVRKRLHLVKDPKQPSLYSEDVANELRKRFSTQVPEAVVTVFGPPPVRGVGRAGGYKIMVEDRGDIGMVELQTQTEKLVERANKVQILPDGDILVPGEGDRAGGRRGVPALVGNTSPFRANVPQIYADVNRTECMTKEVDLQDLFETLRVYLGSLYVNDFNRFGRTWQVIVQAESKFRNQAEDVKLLKVRNIHGTMIPVAALADFKEMNGPLVLTRYNMYPAAPINGSAAMGVSSGEAIDIMSRLAGDPDKGLPSTMAFEWSELAYLELQAGNTAMIIFAFAVVMVFLVLAAQYESWSLPLAIILVVPMCLLSAIAGVKFARDDVNIFTQIGFVVLVGLASKNAILIVEFAKYHRDAGESRRQATLEACRLRLRPIVMTSLAFILGVVPLIIGHGAGAEMRRTLGSTVFSGMLGVTIFGIFLTPVFFYVIDWLGDARVFKSPLFRWINTVVLGTLSLRPVRQFARNRVRSGKPAPTNAPGFMDEPEPEASPEPTPEDEPELEPSLSSTPADPSR